MFRDAELIAAALGVAGERVPLPANPGGPPMIRTTASDVFATDALERIVARLAQLGTVAMIGPDSVIAPCPMGHAATLAVEVRAGRVSLTCSAGCAPSLLAFALGIDERDSTNKGDSR